MGELYYFSYYFTVNLVVLDTLMNHKQALINHIFIYP